MSVFNIDHINTVWRLLVPPDRRLPKWLAWGAAVLSGKQWKQEAFFTGYMTGALNLPPPSNILPAPAVYSNSSTYTSGQTVIYAIQGGGSYFGDNGVYQTLQAISVAGTHPPVGTSVVPGSAPASANSSSMAATAYLTAGNFYWVKVQDNFIGANERVLYNASRLVFEYALNKWFYNSATHYRDPASGTSDIYIVPNVLDYDMLYMGPAGNGYNFIPAGYGEAMPYVNLTSVSAANYDFSIHFPVAIYNDLVSTNPAILPYEAAITAGNNSPLRDSIVRAFADRLNAAGMTYNIITY